MRFGKYLAIMPFRTGRHEARPVRLASVADQIAARGLSHVGSWDTAMAYRPDRRMMEMMMIKPSIESAFELCIGHYQGLPPMPNTNISDILCFRGKFKVLITGSGNTAIAMSVAMFIAALKNHIGTLIVHCF